MVFILITIAIISHEAGHYIVAALCGGKPRLAIVWRTFKGIRYPGFAVIIENAVPFKDEIFEDGRYTVNHKGHLFGIAGFAAEILVGVIMVAVMYADGGLVSKADALMYLSICLAHFVTYPFRMHGKEGNDFYWLA